METCSSRNHPSPAHTFIRAGSRCFALTGGTLPGVTCSGSSSCRAITRSKASTTSGSNCDPEDSWMIVSASCGVRPRR